jgi:hypothetical protein
MVDARTWRRPEGVRRSARVALGQMRQMRIGMITYV